MMPALVKCPDKVEDTFVFILEERKATSLFFSAVGLPIGLPLCLWYDHGNADFHKPTTTPS